MREDRLLDLNYDWGSHKVLMESIHTMNVFSFKKAHELVDKHALKKVHAGIMEDWVATNDLIYSNGEWLFDKTDAYVWSKWGTPIIVDMETDKEYECYITIPYPEYESKRHDYTNW